MQNAQSSVSLRASDHTGVAIRSLNGQLTIVNAECGMHNLRCHCEPVITLAWQSPKTTHRTDSNIVGATIGRPSGVQCTPLQSKSVCGADTAIVHCLPFFPSALPSLAPTSFSSVSPVPVQNRAVCPPPPPQAGPSGDAETPARRRGAPENPAPAPVFSVRTPYLPK